MYVKEEDMTISVTGEILPKELREITAQVEAVNVPDGKTAVISPKEKTVTLKSIEDASNIKLKLSVDVGKMTEAEKILPVQIETDSDIDIIGTYSVLVRMEQGE